MRPGEGGTALELPPSEHRRGPAARTAIFYNPAMALDRDLGVAVLRARARSHPRSAEGWEMLAATGVRGLRLLAETEAFAELYLTEQNPEAFDRLAANARRMADRTVHCERWDARQPLGMERFDYVDLDPYGSPAPFLDSALAAVRPGGWVAITATDLPVLAGVQRRACERRYGATPLRGALGPEAGLRILLAYVDRNARQRGWALRPLLAYVLGHHVRLYGERVPASGPPPVGTLRADAPELPTLPGPGPFGPLWTGPLFDPEFVRQLTVPATAEHPEELRRLLARFAEESLVPGVLWHEGNRLARATGIAEPPSLDRILAALRERGYAAARAHPHPGAFRTNAPRSEVEATVRRLAPGPSRAG